MVGRKAPPHFRRRTNLINRLFRALVIIGSLVVAVPVAAQTSVPFVPVAGTGEPAGRLFLGALGGAGAVQDVSGVFGGELGLRVTSRIDLFAEGVWLQDVATRRRLGLASEVASTLQTSQGSVASGTIDVPTVSADAGVRFTLTGGRVRPYVVVGAGMARMTLKPSFVLGGSNVTASLPTYGVTLGSDLSGESTAPAFTGGLGLRMAQGRWYLDGGLRATRIQAADEGITAVRATATFGLIF
ncbi:MAG TPA: hypothetical protein VIX35_10910 [Vicinamibacterales bacterium]